MALDDNVLLKVLRNKLANRDNGKGALMVRALMAGMTNREVLAHLVERNHVPSYCSINSSETACAGSATT